MVLFSCPFLEEATAEKVVAFLYNKIMKGENTMNRCWGVWFKAAGIRAIKTVAQTAVATIGTTAVLSDVDWLMVASAAVLAGVLSLLTSLAGIPEECKGEAEGTDVNV